MPRWVLVLSAAALATGLLSGCGAVGGVASLAGSAIHAAGKAVETATDVVTAPIR